MKVCIFSSCPLQSFLFALQYRLIEGHVQFSSPNVLARRGSPVMQNTKLTFHRIGPLQCTGPIRSSSRDVCLYGTKWVGRIVKKSMSYFLHLCDCSLPYCATLEAWNWSVVGQHLNASHPRSPVWPNQNVTLFSGNYFLKNFKRSLLLNR